MAWNAKPLNGYELDSNEAKENANEAASIFSYCGFSLLAYSAICGAFQQECSMNPWQWEGNDVQPSSGFSGYVGYGLPQFTPGDDYASGYLGVANTLGDAQINANYSPHFSDVAGTANDGAAQCYFIARYHLTDRDYGWFTGDLSSPYEPLISPYISASDAHIAVTMPVSNFILGLDSSNNPYSIDAMIGAFVSCYLRPNREYVASLFGSTYLTYARWYYEYFSGQPHPPDPPIPPVPPTLENASHLKPWWFTPFIRRK